MRRASSRSPGDIAASATTLRRAAARAASAKERSREALWKRTVDASRYLWGYKLAFPGTKGALDRVVFGYGALIAFHELKRSEKQDLRPDGQGRIYRFLRRLGFRVRVLRTPDEVRTELETLEERSRAKAPTR